MVSNAAVNAAYYTTYEEKAGEGVYDISEDVMLLSAGSISGNYGVGTSNVAIFEGVVSKLPYGVHYVYWRDGQYAYHLAYGRELTLTGNRFSAPQVQMVTYSTYYGGGGQASFTSSTDNNFSLNAGNYLVWSDLGDYPQLETGKGMRDYAKAACVGLAVFGLYHLFRSFSRSIRGRLD